MKPARCGQDPILRMRRRVALIGYHGEFLTDTRGSGVLNRLFHWTTPTRARSRPPQGVLISMENGTSVAFALWNLEGPRQDVHSAPRSRLSGMIIGEHSRRMTSR